MGRVQESRGSKSGKRLHALKAVIRREFGKIFNDAELYALIFIVPAAACIILGSIYVNRVVIDMPAAVYDADNSALSRQIVRSLDATRSLDTGMRVNSVAEIEEAFLRGEIQAAFVIPADFESDVKSGRRAVISVYKNSANLVIGNLVKKDALNIAGTFSAGISVKKIRAGGADSGQAIDRAHAISIETHSLFNPGYDYMNYLISGMLPAILVMAVLFDAVLVINSERRKKTLAELFRAADGSAMTVILGKSIPHIIVHTMTGAMLFGLIFPLFGIAFGGPALGAFLLYVFFIVVMFMAGLCISTFVASEVSATQAALFLGTAAFIFSGYTFPTWAMPLPHRVFSGLMPYTHFLGGFMKLYHYDAGISYVLPELGILAVYLLASMVIAWSILHFYLRKQAVAGEQD